MVKYEYREKKISVNVSAQCNRSPHRTPRVEGRGCPRAGTSRLGRAPASGVRQRLLMVAKVCSLAVSPTIHHAAMDERPEMGTGDEGSRIRHGRRCPPAATPPVEMPKHCAASAASRHGSTGIVPLGVARDAYAKGHSHPAADDHRDRGVDSDVVVQLFALLSLYASGRTTLCRKHFVLDHLV